jgi:hypothetical protein
VPGLTPLNSSRTFLEQLNAFQVPRRTTGSLFASKWEVNSRISPSPEKRVSTQNTSRLTAERFDKARGWESQQHPAGRERQYLRARCLWNLCAQHCCGFRSIRTAAVDPDNPHGRAGRCSLSVGIPLRADGGISSGLDYYGHSSRFTLRCKHLIRLLGVRFSVVAGQTDFSER